MKLRSLGRKHTIEMRYLIAVFNILSEKRSRLLFHIAPHFLGLVWGGLSEGAILQT